MKHFGVLSKMHTELGAPIQYYLKLGDDRIHLNKSIETSIEISFEGYQCLSCNLKKKIFRQGFCYDCFYSKPEVGDWVMRPELSKAHLDIEDRDLAFEKEVQLKPHIVYLALSSNVKVGVTRKTQVPTRWIDQGANEAIEIMEAPNRYLAGITEVALKNHVADKTNWRRMLTNEVPELNLLDVRDQLEEFVPDEAKPYFLSDNTKSLELDFPVIRYPEKVKSLNLTKTPNFQGKLMGIKGQYLIFEDNTVFNVRGNEGTLVSLSL